MASIIQVVKVPSDKALSEISRRTASILGGAKSSAGRIVCNNTRLVIILPPPIASFGNISRYQHRGAKPARRSTPL